MNHTQSDLDRITAQKGYYIHENNDHSKISDAVAKCNQAPALGATIRGETKGVARPRVRFVGWRVRPIDPDNFAGSVKDLLDGLVMAGLIDGDENWRITLETSQERVGTFKEERTEITIEWP